MRSFQQLVVFFFALFAFALAQDSAEYDATVYITSTVYRVNTITLSGTSTGTVGNTTSTIYPSIPSAVTPAYPSGNGTTIAPTGTAAPTTSAPVDFPGAASTLNVNAFVAAMAVLVGYMAL
jgi:hypothetical protein